MNIIIPMAGAGTRFSNAGFTLPKPLIPVRGKPMIEQVINDLNLDGRYIFIVQKAHYDTYNLSNLLNRLKPGCDIVQTDGLTQGGACSTLLAKDLIDSSQLIIANSDAMLDWDKTVINNVDEDGGIVTFECDNPKYGYVKADKYVQEIAEKRVVSNQAMAGIHIWNDGLTYMSYAEEMIRADRKVNNEFYVCMVHQKAIEDGMKFGVYPAKKMWDLGTPEDLEKFLKEHE